MPDALGQTALSLYSLNPEGSSPVVRPALGLASLVKAAGGCGQPSAPSPEHLRNPSLQAEAAKERTLYW